MKIAIIFPTKLDKNKKPIKYKKAFLPPLNTAILNSLTPAKHSVKVINDIVEDIDFSDSYDLVAITAMTTQINRAYQIADRFRKLGVMVVIGGVHANFLPDEVKQHADSVVIGEVENLWEQIINDSENNNLKDFYKDMSLPDLQKLLIPKWENVNLNIYPKPIGYKLPMMPIFTTRGCPYGCKFCSVTKYFGNAYRVKPISHVMREIEAVDAESYFFVDDNIACKPEYSRELFKALSHKNVRWVSQISTTVLRNPDLIELASKSGCTSLLIGIESLDRKNLQSAGKGFNKTEEYEELFARLRKAGIVPFPNIIFGFDNDSPEVFRSTIDFLMKNKVGYATFFILTPLPGTIFFDEMNNAGRLPHKDWSKYDLNHIVFKPQKLTKSELYSHYWKSYQEFFSLKNITKRIYYNIALSKKDLFKVILENLFYQFFIRREVNSYEHPFSGGIGRIKSRR